MKYKLFIGFFAMELMILIIMFITASVTATNMQAEFPAKHQLVKTFMLTDLAIWTEARYARHPSQADFFTPFQDFPAAIEHFPSGSILAPPKPSDFIKFPDKKS